MLHIVWEFEVGAARVQEFERHYCASGTWAKLFQQSPGYQKTILIRDHDKAGRYLTTDVWDDFNSYERFKADKRSEYSELDAQFEALTAAEKFIGYFEEVE